MNTTLKPRKFKEMNVTLAEAQPEYQPLPVYVRKPDPLVISCWHVSFVQRLLLLFTGRIWLIVKGRLPVHPVVLDCGRTVFRYPTGKKAKK